MKKFVFIFIIGYLLIPTMITTAQDPPEDSEGLDRNACYEGGFLYP